MGKKISKWPGGYHKVVIGETGFKLKHSIRDHHIITVSVRVIMEERLSGKRLSILVSQTVFYSSMYWTRRTYDKNVVYLKSTKLQ